MYSWGFDVGGSAKWVFVTHPLNWHAFPHKGIRINQGIILKQVGAEEPLLKWSIRQSIRFSFQDLLRLAGHCGVEGNVSPTRHFSPGDSSYAEAVKSSARSEAIRQLVDDPLFDAAYDALDDDDKREFPEVREARQKGKTRKFEDALN